MVSLLTLVFLLSVVLFWFYAGGLNLSIFRVLVCVNASTPLSSG